MINKIKTMYVYVSCVVTALLFFSVCVLGVRFYCHKDLKESFPSNVQVSLDVKNLGVIMDGNRRWAKEQNKSYKESYIEGAKKFLELVELSVKKELNHLVVYALSLDNIQKRDKFTEIDVIYDVFKSFFYKESDWFLKRNINLKFIGNIEVFPSIIQEIVAELEEKTKDCTGLKVSILFAYNFYEDVKRGYLNMLKKENIDSVSQKAGEEFTAYFQSSHIPNLDLVIRTGSAERLSGFLPLQSMYAELVFLSCMWPSIKVSDIEMILDTFSQKSHIKNFGK